MQPQIIGISGSPIKNSNTDRLVQSVLESSGLTSEFVKLSKINVRPCIACLGCKKDNICKVKDDFPELAEKIRHAGAVVVGGYSPYGAIDGFTKAFLERLFSLRHQNGLNRGKLAVVVTTGIGRGVPGLEEACNQIAHTLTLEGVEGQAKKTIPGYRSRRWVAEACNPWFNRFRKILVRYEKNLASYLALHHLAAAIICWQKNWCYLRISP